MNDFSALSSQASWISYTQESPRIDARRAVTIFATDFELAPNQNLARATLQATALGVYRGFLNGSDITDAKLLPGFTEYNHRLQAQDFDVTALVRDGSNQLWFELSDGWYRGQIGVMRSTDQWGSQTAVTALLRLEFTDGTERAIATNSSWRHRHSSHLADMCEGEWVDFNIDVPGELDPVNPATADWQPAKEIEPKQGELIAEIAPSVRATAELAPVNILTLDDGLLVDFGQNIGGWIRLSDLGPAGTKLRIVHGEALDSDGSLTQANFKPDVPFLPRQVTAGQIDHVISAGVAGQVFEPQHSTKGFRYVFIDGWPITHVLSPDDIRAIVVHTDLEPVGEFECSNDDLNWLHEATRWSLRSNAIEIPTDCPTRERAGWAADWEIFFQSGAFMFDVSDFTRKWLRDLVIKQWSTGVVPNMAPQPDSEGEGSPIAHLNGSAGWGDAIVNIPWKHYNAYGDISVLEEFWPNMVRWMDYVTSQAATKRHPSRIDRNEQPLPHERYIWDSGFHFGEWLEPDPSGKELDFGALVQSDQGIVATAYFAQSTALMSRIAMVLGKAAEAASYVELSLKVREAWNQEFIDAFGRINVPTQANCVRALRFALLKPQYQKSVERQLVELVHAAGDHLGTGFLATPYLLPALADIGEAELAYQVLTQRTWPSWLRMKDLGATTVWERWEGYDHDGHPSESHNHYSKGAVISFLHQYIAGLRPDPNQTYATQLTVQPLPLGDLTWAKASHRTSNGELISHWTRSGENFQLNLTVPQGCTAYVVLPDGARHTATGGVHTFNCEL